MNLTITNDTVHYINFNGQRVDYLYYGNDLVWPKQDILYETMPLTVEGADLSSESSVGLFGMTGPSGYTFEYRKKYKTSENWDSNWTQVTLTSNSRYWTTSLDTNTMIQFRSSYIIYRDENTDLREEGCYTIDQGSYPSYPKFITTTTYKVYGNIMSMMWGSEFIGKKTYKIPLTMSSREFVNGWKGAFMGLFSEPIKSGQYTIIVSSPTKQQYISWLSQFILWNVEDGAGFTVGHGLVDAENLVLPIDLRQNLSDYSIVPYHREGYGYYDQPIKFYSTATGYSSYSRAGYTYLGLFCNCTLLQKIPKSITCTAYTNGDFNYMFYNCISIEDASTFTIDAPRIWETHASYTGFFNYMFYGCVNLKTPPKKMFVSWLNMNERYNSTYGFGYRRWYKEADYYVPAVNKSFSTRSDSSNTFGACYELTTYPSIAIANMTTGSSSNWVTTTISMRDPSTTETYIGNFNKFAICNYLGKSENTVYGSFDVTASISATNKNSELVNIYLAGQRYTNIPTDSKYSVHEISIEDFLALDF